MEPVWSLFHSAARAQGIQRPKRPARVRQHPRFERVGEEVGLARRRYGHGAAPHYFGVRDRRGLTSRELAAAVFQTSRRGRAPPI